VMSLDKKVGEVNKLHVCVSGYRKYVRLTNKQHVAVTQHLKCIVFSFYVSVVLVLLSVCALSKAWCPTNCVCTTTDTECFVRSCSDEVFLDTLMLTIHGHLCPIHRLQLYSFEGMLQLEDDRCDDLPNCV